MKIHEDKALKKIVLLILIILVICIIIGISYALWVVTVNQTSINNITSDCLNIVFTDDDSITIKDAFPITDSKAKTLTPYTFTIENVCSLSVTYDVNLEIMDATNRLNSKYIAVDFNDTGKDLLSNLPTATPTYSDKTYKATEARLLKTGTLDGNSSITYNLRIWMDESVTTNDDVMNKNFTSKISVNASFNQVANIYKEEILNGTDPVISGDLIPVKIADDGTVTKASLQEEWYSYENKVWANAIILKDKTKTYNDGDTIPEDNIESYFVWIPKYSYQLWDLGEYTSVTELSSWSDLTDESPVHTIPIKFGTTNTIDKNGECATPLTSGGTGNCKVGDYMTHPAFINANTNGLWVGKFETGYDGATTTAEAQVLSTDSTKIIVKPNVYSWRSNTVYNFFMALYNYNRDLDSHMMKNTEWGAVAYLSHSIYGVNGEVWINNGNYLTGCVGDSVSASGYNGCQNAYNTTTGFNGNTTGNISGIYDMSGGAWEYVAAYVDGNVGSSGFSNKNLTLYAAYLDVYNFASTTSFYNYRILGDATGEMGPFYFFKDNAGYISHNNWYSDFSNFVSSSTPWFNRGGASGRSHGSGQFNFGSETGEAYEWASTRLVLAP